MKRIIGLVLFLVGIGAICFSIFRNITAYSTRLPEAIRFNLPHFSGARFSDQVREGDDPTPLPEKIISKPFEEVNRWGENAVLAYQLVGETLSIEVWRPDPNTKDFFQYAKRDYEIQWPGNQWPTSISSKEVLKSGNELVVLPYRRIDYLFPALIIMFGGVLAFNGFMMLLNQKGGVI